ncbi:hypothetical protein L596_030227 [Steinernema carpocapsae]|uniref:Uncharacterized protein n=1 Tax=Steinernema carpocapsae TaxID=34508 RepID=A0A4U5LS48_STECR|nr:hypothetical protein L596_030227 [Steinernema carpocapsae]
MSKLEKSAEASHAINKWCFLSEKITKYLAAAGVYAEVERVNILIIRNFAKFGTLKKFFLVFAKSVPCVLQ